MWAGARILPVVVKRLYSGFLFRLGAIMRALKSLYLAAALALSGAALAADPALRYNVVELQAEAQREAPNDTLSASLYVELNDANPAALVGA